MVKKINLNPIKENLNLFLFEELNAGILELSLVNKVFEMVEGCVNEII
jgi:hypothetical protein